MTTLNEASTAAYQRFQVDWPTAQPDVPFTFEDEDFTPPVTAAGRPAPWVKLSVQNLGGRQETLGAAGNRKFTRSALVRVQVYTAPGTGRKVSDLLCQSALDIFEGRALAGALVYDGAAREIGLVENNRWKLSTVEVSFDYEQVK